jgi:hypothetical protein
MTDVLVTKPRGPTPCGQCGSHYEWDVMTVVFLPHANDKTPWIRCSQCRAGLKAAEERAAEARKPEVAARNIAAMKRNR